MAPYEPQSNLKGRELVRRFFELTYNQLRFDEAMDYFDEAGTWEDYSFSSVHYGKPNVRKMLGNLGDGFPKSLQARVQTITGDEECVAMRYQFTWDGVPIEGSSVLCMVKLTKGGTKIESWTDAPEHFVKVGEPAILGIMGIMNGFDSFRQNIPNEIVDNLPADVAKFLRRQ